MKLSTSPRGAPDGERNPQRDVETGVPIEHHGSPPAGQVRRRQEKDRVRAFRGGDDTSLTFENLFTHNCSLLEARLAVGGYVAYH